MALFHRIAAVFILAWLTVAVDGNQLNSCAAGDASGQCGGTTQVHNHYAVDDFEETDDESTFLQVGVRVSTREQQLASAAEGGQMKPGVIVKKRGKKPKPA
eukprot:gnl/TRDRNA2_/TRDRNA2_180681_c0_seq1.p1 gnl/TRDRNA2_/TRDRNA2_180681_c0~~gnl/TRDRNA2_/TRDRNA2_180681_c0_seq1.p1  ORF type:complete len:101 (-),score=26.03 gnl/TRDRNA2_/TRDRNA2_180681_c0_seq1:29-331(-)